MYLLTSWCFIIIVNDSDIIVNDSDIIVNDGYGDGVRGDNDSGS